MSLQTKRNASVWEMSRSFLVFDVVPRNRFFWVAKGTTKEDVGLNTPSHGVRVLQFYSWIPRDTARFTSTAKRQLQSGDDLGGRPLQRTDGGLSNESLTSIFILH